MKERKSAKLNHQDSDEQIHHENSHLGSFKFAKLFDSEASWDKDQLGDVLHWIRQVVGLLCGLIWGAIPLVGGIWLLLFLAISSGIVYGYYALILKIDEEDYGGHAALLQDGLFASLSVFLRGFWCIACLASDRDTTVLCLSLLKPLLGRSLEECALSWFLRLQSLLYAALDAFVFLKMGTSIGRSCGFS
ncbi:hypothetical protein HID58_062486 [Brassica napus]|uniref:Rab5-interacting protein n=1 Tax=Brassica napus TaxID=3708 RepID=A0ABQ8A2T2_BRANA|nr:hypothetical protein HID58_062486 [Brassica napus]